MSTNHEEEMIFSYEGIIEGGPPNARHSRSSPASSSTTSLQADSLALYHAVGEGHGRMLVEAFGHAAQNAILAAAFASSDFSVEGPREDSNRNEEKVDEFYLQRHFPISIRGNYGRSSSLSSYASALPADPKSRSVTNWKGFFSTAGVGLLNPSWIRQYTRTSSFVLGNYYMQNMVHHPWASASMHDRHISLNDVKDILKRCGTNIQHKVAPKVYKERKERVPSISGTPSLNIISSDHARVPASSQDVGPCPVLFDEDIRYLCRVLSNVRPPPDFSFTASDAARKSNNFSGASPGHNDDARSDEQTEESSVDNGEGAASNVLFDGSHGANNGTLLHLACIADSPLALALLLTLGGDPTTRFTAFRRLPIHEAACCGSTLCLTLLLELSNFLEQQESVSVSDAVHPTFDERGGGSSSSRLFSSLKQPYSDDNLHQNMNDHFDSLVDSKPMAKVTTDSNFATNDADKFPEKKMSANRVCLPSSECYGKHSFIDIMSLVLDLQYCIDNGRMTELDAARSLINQVGVPHSVRQSVTAMLPISTATDGHGNTALHWAAFKNEVESVRVLLTYGADANVRANHSGWTPLHDAAYSDSADSVSLLIDAGARLDARSNSGATPLCFAAQEDSPNAVEALLRAGADPGVQCCGHNAHANLAERTYLNDAQGVNENQAMEEGGVTDTNNGQNGPHIEDHNIRRANNRLFSTERGTGRLRQHLEHQLPLRLMFVPSRFSGYTPLHYCAHYNAHEAARVLLRYNAPMEVEDMSSRRPIHVAAARGSSDVLRELLKAGACVETIPTRYGVTSRRSHRHISAFPSSPSTSMMVPQRGFEPTSAPSRLESFSRLISQTNNFTQHPQGLALHDDSIENNPARVSSGFPSVPVLSMGDNSTNGNETNGHGNEESTESFVPFVPFPGPPASSNVSSPVLKAMIPSRPVSSNKPWNCLTQKAIDECNQLIAAAEGHWSPQTHQVFSPADRRGVLELLRVGKRLEQEGTGIFLDLWPVVLSFCGRGWFQRDEVEERVIHPISENAARATTPFHLDESGDESIYDEDFQYEGSESRTGTEHITRKAQSARTPQALSNVTHFRMHDYIHARGISHEFTQFHFDDLESVNDEQMIGGSTSSDMADDSGDDSS